MGTRLEIRRIENGDPAEMVRLSKKVYGDKNELYGSDLSDFEEMLRDIPNYTHVAVTKPEPAFPRGRPVGMSASVILTRRPTVKDWEAKYSRKNLSTWHNPGGMCFYLAWLMVKPENQNEGIGTELFYTNAKLARSNGFGDMNFLASERDEKFYTGLGAKPIEREYTSYFGKPNRWWEFNVANAGPAKGSR